MTVTLLQLQQQVDGPMLTTVEVSAVLGLGDELLRQMFQAGDIRAVRLGRKYRIPWRSLREYLYRTRVLPLPECELRVPR